MRKIHRLLLLCLAVLVAGLPLSVTASYSEDTVAPLADWVSVLMENQPLNAHAALAFDLTTGEVLFSQQADEQLYMASLTKIMTALVITDRYNLNQMITAKKNYQPILAPHNGPQVLKGGSIKKGETFYAGSLFKTMMVYSANDAALLFADTLAGSSSKFVSLMNQKAKALGMTHTRFTNPHGLSTNGEQIGQTTTARDLQLLMSAALKKPAILEAVQLKEFTLKSNFRTHTYTNTNLLLTNYDGTFGLKTGSTALAGSCLASAVHKPFGSFAIVTLRGTGRSLAARDHMKLYDVIQQAVDLRTLFMASGDSEPADASIPLETPETLETPLDSE